MSLIRILPVVAAVVLALGIGDHTTVKASENAGFNLLRLGGAWVKWGAPKLGTHAEVTYAFASQSMKFPNARNCSALEPVVPVLKSSGITEFAFGEWSRVAGINFQAVADASTADIVIGAQKFPRGRAYSNVSYSSVNKKGARQISRSLICLNPDREWKLGFDGDLDVYDLRYTLIHEIGHAIGLDHPGPHGQLMSFRYHEKFRKLQAGDMAGAAALYGGPRRRTGAAAKASSSVAEKSAPRDLSLGKN